jgi:hypothetical protein
MREELKTKFKQITILEPVEYGDELFIYSFTPVVDEYLAFYVEVQNELPITNWIYALSERSEILKLKNDIKLKDRNLVYRDFFQNSKRLFLVKKLQNEIIWIKGVEFDEIPTEYLHI